MRILDADQLVLLSWTFGGQFDLQGVPPAFAGFAASLPESKQGQPGSDEIGIIQVSTREATSEETRQLLHHAAHGPSGLPPSLRDQLKVRLEGARIQARLPTG